jgi:hypothetical protein
MGQPADLGRRAALIASCAILAGCHGEHWLTYPWDDRRVLCSQPVDDLTLDVPWDLVEDQMLDAAQTRSVLVLHAHTPGATITTGAIERVLSTAEDRGLAFLTFRDLDPSATPRAGLAFAFDDNAIDAWFGVRDLLAAHGAHVTFFVTRWQTRSDTERAELRVLADDGHDIEPHSTNHLHAPAYVKEHGMDAYLADEVMPSIDGLVQAGYPPPTTYAYPFGQNSPALDEAILQIVPRVRVSTGTCPY